MKKVIALIISLLSLLVVFVLPVSADYAENHTETAAEHFVDVSEDDWYYEYVNKLYQKGVIAGTSDNTFSPDRPITREEFVVISEKLARSDSVTPDPRHYEEQFFSDVEPNQWYSDYIAAAYNSKWICGIGNGLFGLGRYMTREEAAVMFISVEKQNMYLDTKTYPYIGECYVNDWETASDYAKKSVKIVSSIIWWDFTDYFGPIVYSSPIFVGNEKGEFMPHKYLTRAEAAIVLMRRQYPDYH